MLRRIGRRRSGRRAPAGYAAALALFCWMAVEGVDGQVLSGTVLDAESAEPVPLAYVGLLEPGRELVVATLADAEGVFSLEAPEEGSYMLYVIRDGYRAIIDGLFELGENGVMEVSVGLAPAPIPLPSVVVNVEGNVRGLRTVGFYERRDAGMGYFFEREEISRVAMDDVTDALVGIPSFRVVTPVPSARSPMGVQNPEILVRRGTEYCSPTLFVDGHAVAHGSRHASSRTAVRPGDFVDPYDIEAVEVYTRTAETPVQFEAADGCGAMLVWTRSR